MPAAGELAKPVDDDVRANADGTPRRGRASHLALSGADQAQRLFVRLALEVLVEDAVENRAARRGLSEERCAGPQLEIVGVPEHVVRCEILQREKRFRAFDQARP